MISAISRPSCGGACTSSVKAITCIGTRTDGSRARWSYRSDASHCGISDRSFSPESIHASSSSRSFGHSSRSPSARAG